MNELQANNVKPKALPFLEALCWDLPDGTKKLNFDDMLNRYERGWEYLGVLAEADKDEMEFIKHLAERNGSWLAVYV